MSEFKLRVLRLSFLKMINYVYIGIDVQTKKAFVIDPAWDMSAIKQCLDEEEAVLDKILITHSHVDHVNLADRLAKQYGVSVYISEIEKEYYHFQCRNLECFCDGDILRVGNLQIQCMVTPGHSKGSACYFVENHLFTGDTVFIEGCGLCQFAGGSAEEMYHTFQRLKDSISDNVLIYPSHRYGKMPGQTMKFVKDHNIYFSISDVEHFVSFRNRPNVKGTFSFK